MPSEKSAGFFRPFTEQDASCRRQEWEATFPSLINLLNSTQNQPPVRSITISKLTVRPVRVQRDAYVRGGQPKDYDIKFSVEFEDKSVLRKRRSAADLVREVGRKWGLGAGLEAVIFPSAQWKSAKAVTSSVVFKAKERRAALAGGASAQGGEMTSASTGGELGAGVGPCEDTRARERNRGRESAKEGGIGGEKRKGVVAEKKMRSKRGRNDETKDTGAFGTGGTGGSVAATDTEGAQEVRGRKHTHKRRKTNVAPQIETPIGEMETAIAETPANGGRTAGGTVRSQLAKPGTGISAQGSGSRGAKPYKLRKSTDVLEIRKRPKMAASTPADVGGPNEPPPDEERSPLFEPDRWVPTVRLGKSDAGPVPVGQSAGGSLFGDVIPAAAPVQVGRSGVAGLRDADVSDQGEEWVRQSDISEGAKKGAKVGRSGGATPPSRVGGTGRADRESGGAAMDDSGCAVTDRFRKPGAKKRGLFKWVKSGCDRTEGLKRSARQRQEKPDQPAVAEGGPANGGVFTWVGMGERGTGDNASADQGDVFQGGSGAQVTLGERSERARGVNALSEQGTNLEGASGEEGLLGRGKRKRKPIYDTANVFFWPAPRRQRLAAAADRNEGPASEPAIETSERAPEASERVPVASKRASDVPEPAPDASAKPAPGASEPAFTASGAAPGASAPAPDAPIPAPSVPKTAPNTSEPSPDVSEPAVDASGTDPRASETALEASILLGETAGNEECEQQLAEGERRSGVQNFSESKSPPEKSVGGDGDVPVGVPGDSQAKESAGGATERALEREGTGDATEGVKSPDAQARKEPGRATREKRQRRKECVPKERGPLSGVAMREAKKPGNAKTSVDTECLGGSGDVLQPPGRETEVLARERGSELRRDECKVRAGGQTRTEIFSASAWFRFNHSLFDLFDIGKAFWFESSRTDWVYPNLNRVVEPIVASKLGDVPSDRRRDEQPDFKQGLIKHCSKV